MTTADISHAFQDGVKATLIDDPNNEVARFFNEANCKFCGSELYAFPNQNEGTTYWRCGTRFSMRLKVSFRSSGCCEKELAASKAEVKRLSKLTEDCLNVIRVYCPTYYQDAMERFNKTDK